jgi:hypothetical protein
VWWKAAQRGEEGETEMSKAQNQAQWWDYDDAVYELKDAAQEYGEDGVGPARLQIAARRFVRAERLHQRLREQASPGGEEEMRSIAAVRARYFPAEAARLEAEARREAEGGTGEVQELVENLRERLAPAGEESE